MNNAVRSVDTSLIVSLAYVASVRAHGLTDMSVWEGFPSVIYFTVWRRDSGSCLNSFARWGTVWVNKWMVKINYWTNKSDNITLLSRTLESFLASPIPATNYLYMLSVSPLDSSLSNIIFCHFSSHDEYFNNITGLFQASRSLPLHSLLPEYLSLSWPSDNLLFILQNLALASLISMNPSPGENVNPCGFL